VTCPCEELGLFACPRACAATCVAWADPSPWVPKTGEDARKVAWYVTARTGVAVLSVKVMSPFDSSGPRIYLQTPIAESLPRSAGTWEYKRYTVDDVAGAQFVTVPSDWRMGDLPIPHTCMYCGEEFTNERDRDGHEDACMA